VPPPLRNEHRVRINTPDNTYLATPWKRTTIPPHISYIVLGVLSEALPRWPCVYAYSLSEITETKHEAFTQSTPQIICPLCDHYTNYCNGNAWNHVIYGVLLRTQLQLVWLSTCNAIHFFPSQLWKPSSRNPRVTMFKTHFTLYALPRVKIFWGMIP